MIPVLVKRIDLFNNRIDSGLKLNKKTLLGAHKTYRGFIFGIIVGIIIVYIQYLLRQPMKPYNIVDYGSTNILLLGFLLSFGALFGDLIKSFFKRRMEIKAGRSWIPFDQIDWIIGSLAFTALYVTIPLQIIITSFIIYGLLHPTINYLGYMLKLKKNKF
jgi:CDP-2,3-bis-(O-geranylgeranyl)-sn-glycerol synthase